ncbi:MAG: 30S ribosome-binding factor RbfA [Mycoplasma sp.]|nr:30S ribosome-binding factor RbfA [Mycoplasma sp.]
MPNINHLKKEKMFLRAISIIITEEIKNSNIFFPTVTDVKLSGDGSHLKVFLDFESNKEKSLEAIKNIKGFVRTTLSKRINIRKIPEIHFEHDSSIEKGNRIDEILRKIKEEQK